MGLVLFNCDDGPANVTMSVTMASLGIAGGSGTVPVRDVVERRVRATVPRDGNWSAEVDVAPHGVAFVVIG